MRFPLVITLALALSPRAALAEESLPSVAAREADRAAGTAGLAGQRLLRLLDETRLARDPRRIACVDEKLTAVNSFARMIHARRERLLGAEARGDRALATHEARVIRRLVVQLRQLEREGRACVDRSAGRDGTQVEVELAADLPVEDLVISAYPDRGLR